MTSMVVVELAVLCTWSSPVDNILFKPYRECSAVLWVLWLSVGADAADVNSRVFPAGCGIFFNGEIFANAIM
jgi:hypothetical protein